MRVLAQSHLCNRWGGFESCPTPRTSFPKEQLDYRHHYVGLDDRKLEREHALHAAHRGLLGLLLRIVLDPLDLRAVVQQLGVLDLAGEALKVNVLIRPREDMQIEPVAVLRVVAVRRRSEIARGAAVD